MKEKKKNVIASKKAQPTQSIKETTQKKKVKSKKKANPKPCCMSFMLYRCLFCKSGQEFQLALYRNGLMICEKHATRKRKRKETIPTQMETSTFMPLPRPGSCPTVLRKCGIGREEEEEEKLWNIIVSIHKSCRGSIC
jgi:hypothetical protein